MHVKFYQYNFIYKILNLQGLWINSVDADNAVVALVVRAIFVMCSKHLYHSS
jgi:hypothetical protein